ncbi:MAG: hypothetical protein WAW79_08560 [Steroidobacteraceae bacterium]
MLNPRYWLTWLGLGGLRLIEPLPYRWLLGIGRLLGRIIGLLPLSYLRIARRNIEICLPELAPDARKMLLKRHIESLGIGLCETALTWWSPNERVRALAEVNGFEHLQRALARGHGAILVGGHFTTIEIGTRILGTIVPLNVLYRPTRNAVLSAVMERQFRRFGQRAISYDDIRMVVRALKENGAVWYAPDQSYRNKGAAMLPFFGTLAATNTATSRLARMTGAAVLTYFPLRLPDAQGYQVFIGPELENYPSDDPVADTLRFGALLEEQIRDHPEQYLWMHRRFKGLSPDYPDYYGRDARRRRSRA